MNGQFHFCHKRVQEKLDKQLRERIAKKKKYESLDVEDKNILINKNKISRRAVVEKKRISKLRDNFQKYNYAKTTDDGLIAMDKEIQDISTTFREHCITAFDMFHN